MRQLSPDETFLRRMRIPGSRAGSCPVGGAMAVAFHIVHHRRRNRRWSRLWYLLLLLGEVPDEARGARAQGRAESRRHGRSWEPRPRGDLDRALGRPFLWTDAEHVRAQRVLAEPAERPKRALPG